MTGVDHSPLTIQVMKEVLVWKMVGGEQKIEATPSISVEDVQSTWVPGIEGSGELQPSPEQVK